MKMKLWLAALVMSAMVPVGLRAQAPAGAPAGSTGQCKDGTYSTAASKSGACSGHKGVKEWYSAAPAKAAAAPVAAPAPAPAPVKAAKAAKAAPAAAAEAAPTGPAAAGGGPGLVWVNTSTKVYHCNGTKYYGKTKEGKYMTEAAAKAMGAHADHNNPCKA